jgi:hypothetical protein
MPAGEKIRNGKQKRFLDIHSTWIEENILLFEEKTRKSEGGRPILPNSHGKYIEIEQIYT